MAWPSVYEAERRGERFALKRPLSGFLDDPRFLERFLREAELGRTLHHPNIIRIFDRGQVGDIPYFAMELVDGETLRARLDREGRLDPPAAARITSQVAEALDYAHNKGVIHRDLKPSNIMLERSGGLKVMDYGIARAQRLEGLTTTGSFLGTPSYAAPETVEADEPAAQRPLLARRRLLRDADRQPALSRETRLRGAAQPLRHAAARPLLAELRAVEPTRPDRAAPAEQGALRSGPRPSSC